MLGFTKAEERVVVFLIAGFLIGSGIRFYQNRFAPLPEPEKAFPVPGAADRFVVEEKNLSELPVSINTAGEEEMTRLPGIGPALARRILEYREQNGPFQKPEDLLKVQGIGSKKLEKMRARIILHQANEISESYERL